jgi:hypothetical protein
MVTSSANVGVARNSAAKSDAPRVLRIISYLLFDRLRPTSIWDLDCERNLKEEIEDACQSHAGGGKPPNRDQCGKPPFSGARL